MLRACAALACLCTAWNLCAADYPSADISNGILKAQLLLPDPEHGYYRGTRFDWSGVIASLEFQGHQFFGQWFERYDPKLHDAIMGPVEEYRTNEAGLGYDAAKPGDTFIRIGVGTVRKPEETAYQTFHTYDIVDPGKWSVRNGKNWVEFTHDLRGGGYGYRYTKTVRLVEGQPQMVLEHSLRNTGSKTIETAQYNHNFFVIDNQLTGPDVTVTFPFEPHAVKSLPEPGIFEGRALTWSRPLEKGGQSVYSELTGFGPDASSYDFRIENRKSGAGVRIRGDRPLVKLIFWSIRTVACPEPYIQMTVEPGSEVKWTNTYDFYTTERR